MKANPLGQGYLAPRSDLERRQIDVDREAVRRGGLWEFIRRAWPVIVPVPMRDNWHIGAKCELLTAAWRRHIRTFVINEPPGCMKSLAVAVFYPAWVWTEEEHAPGLERLGPGAAEKFLYVTYADDIAERDAALMRDLVSSDWFKLRWGQRCYLPLKASRKIKNFWNSKRGWRYSTSTQGQITGRHPNQIIYDDPIKAQDVVGGAEATRVQLDKAWNLWSNVLATRNADPASTVRGMIMQRLHDADPAGRALASGDIDVHLMLPMRYEPGRRCSVHVKGFDFEDPRREEGELLWPSFYDPESVKKLFSRLGVHAAAQLQQDPVPSGGGIFQTDWLTRFWTFDGKPPAGADPTEIVVKLPDRREFTDAVISLDASFKEAEGADDVALGAWGSRFADSYLLDQVADRMSYVKTRAAFRGLCARFSWIARKLIEDKANGSAILSDLHGEIPGLIAVEPQGGKVARANAVSTFFQSGNVYLPHPLMPGFGWVREYIAQLTRFPRATHDDMVDQTSQALSNLHFEGNELEAAMQALAKGDREKTMRGTGAVVWVAFRPWAASAEALGLLAERFRRLPCLAEMHAIDGAWCVNDGWYYLQTDNPDFILAECETWVREITTV